MDKKTFKKKTPWTPDGKETVFFQLYSNIAVNNICEVAGIDESIFQPERIRKELGKKSGEEIRKLANFLWLFNISEPNKEFPDYKEITIVLVEKIYALRNYFTHFDNPNNSKLLEVDNQLYNRLHKWLYVRIWQNACNIAMNKGGIAGKLLKLKLFEKSKEEPRKFNRNRPRQFQRWHHQKFEKSKEEPRKFNRRGIIFIICLALYKNEAELFCHSLHDMKFPLRNKSEEELNDLQKKYPKSNAIDPIKENKFKEARTICNAFTAFSIRPGRNDIDSENVHFRRFSDIICYLNKVPMVSWRYLGLKKENERLSKLKNDSLESEENKETKYRLFPRLKERFLSIALGAVEDFGWFECLKFKRINTSCGENRQRYCFGAKPEEKQVFSNKHFSTKDNAVSFEFVPTEHYPKAKIKIRSLRSKFGEKEFKCLLALSACNKDKLVNAEIKSYFKAYTCVLEYLLNNDECSFDKKDVMDELITITGKSKEELNSERFDEIVAPYFSKLVSQCLGGYKKEEIFENKGDLEDFCKRRLETLIHNVSDLLKRMEKRKNWMDLSLEDKQNLKEDHKKYYENTVILLPLNSQSRQDGVYNDPRTTKFTDKELIELVFDYINLYLENRDKFRQLPKVEQHRGEIDCGYQSMHKKIGVFIFMRNQDEFWKAFSKKVGKESVCYKELHEEMQKYDKPTLFDLAKAATILRLQYYLNLQKKQNLSKECSKLGVKQGLELTHENLVKSILHIDVNSWKNAYDYEAKSRGENGKRSSPRDLSSVDHIVSQIPVPKDFAERIAVKIDKRFPGSIMGMKSENGRFDFNKLFKDKIHTKGFKLRDFYDVAPLLDYSKSHKEDKDPNAFADCEATEDICKKSLARFAKSALSSAIADIKNVNNQDRLLSFFAKMYYEKYSGEMKKSFEDNTDIYEIFKQEWVESVGDVKFSVTLFDMNKPFFAQVKEYAKFITEKIGQRDDKRYTYLELQEKLQKEIRPKDREERLVFMESLQKFEKHPLRRFLDDMIEEWAKKAKGKIVDFLTKNASSKEFQEAVKGKINRSEYKSCIKDGIEVFIKDVIKVLNVRNAVFHNGCCLEISPALKVLKKWGDWLPLKKSRCRRSLGKNGSKYLKNEECGCRRLQKNIYNEQNRGDGV